MVIDHLERDSILLVADTLDMEASQELSQYVMTEWQLSQRDENKAEAGVNLEITFKRRLMGEMLVTYLPSTLLIEITYLTAFIRSDNFDTALVANLTILLVMTNIFISAIKCD